MNRSELIRYLKELADDGMVQLREKEINTSVGDFLLAHARISHRGSNIDGYGVAAIRDDAIDKALWETLERRFFRFTQFSLEDFKPFPMIQRLIGGLTGIFRLQDLRNLGEHSVGCAIHSSKNQAALAAVHELIERHTVLVAQLMSQPGHKVDCGNISWNGLNIAISHYCWQGALRTFCVLSEITHRDDGRVLFSTGVGNTLEAACNKALIEALGHIENFELESLKAPDLHLSRRISDLKRWHMLNFNRKPFYREGKTLTAPPPVDTFLDRSRFWVAMKALGSGLYFARAYSPDIQNLFVGHWELSRIHARFQHLWKEDLEPPYAY